MTMMMMMRVTTTMGLTAVMNGCMADCRPYVTVYSAAGVCPLQGATPGVHDDGCDDDVDDDDVDDDGDRCHWRGSLQTLSRCTRHSLCAACLGLTHDKVVVVVVMATMVVVLMTMTIILWMMVGGGGGGGGGEIMTTTMVVVMMMVMTMMVVMLTTAAAVVVIMKTMLVVVVMMMTTILVVVVMMTMPVTIRMMLMVLAMTVKMVMMIKAMTIMMLLMVMMVLNGVMSRWQTAGHVTMHGTTSGFMVKMTMLEMMMSVAVMAAVLLLPNSFTRAKSRAQ